MNRIIITVLFAAALTAGASAQIMKAGEATQAPAKVQGGGAVVPWLTYGLQTTEAIGYNLDTGASGMSFDTTNAHPDTNTTAWFSIALLDGVAEGPLAFQTAEASEDWKTTFTFKNFSARLSSANNIELKKPSWTAEVRGAGYRFGLMSQAGRDIGDSANNNPALTLVGANQVLNLSGTADAAATDYITSLSPQAVVFKGTEKNSGLAYAGYESKGLFNTFVTVFAEGNVGSSMTPAVGTAKTQGWAVAWEGMATPLGSVSQAVPVAPTIKADLIKGFGFEASPTATNANNPGRNTGGLGLGTQVDLWLADGMVLSPTGAFDLRLNDLKVTGHLAESEWEAGGGLMLQVGEALFTNDDWNELSAIKATYITNKIRKVAYVQALGMYSDATDLDLAVKAEEPDGNLGIDENIGAMVEYRVNNVRKLNDLPTAWSATGRLSYDLADHTIVPYLRFYANGSNFVGLNADTTVKVRAGVQLALLPGFGLEAAYMTPQLYTGATKAKDAGKLELLATFKTEGGEAKKVFTPKTMYFEDWNK